MLESLGKNNRELVEDGPKSSSPSLEDAAPGLNMNDRVRISVRRAPASKLWLSSKESL
jgi:hypothetical protein